MYELEHTLQQIRCFSTNAYIYTKVMEDKLEDVKRLNEMKTLVARMIEDNSAMRHLANDEAYRTKLHDMNDANRKKLSDIETQLARYM